MADVQIVAGGVSAAPLAYTVPGAQEIIVKALTATFDGSGAATSFVPAIEVVAPSGKTVGTYTAVGSVAAAGSADVSFGPFLVGVGSGIQYDTLNSGDWLSITTTGVQVQGVVDHGGFELDVNGAASDAYVNVGRDENHEVGRDLNLDTAHDINMTTANDALLAPANTLRITGSDLEVLVGVYDLAGTTSIRLTPGGTTAQFYGDGGIWLWDARPQTAFGVQVLIGNGSKFEFQDHNQNPIFRINEDGSLHGKTGKTLVFDL